ncbi:MAG: cell division FtsA domain-containing protein [Syntrophomonadaceae bacterium]|nr:cell division FtsA domain-containing protein [Syntrophomonadaceae bacterium]
METFFHSEPRIEEWANEIIDSIFKACQSSGVDSEAGFQRGSLIVTNLTRLLQGISEFPIEYLEDALKQLLEQQIPDSPGVNTPAFQVTMNKMLHEGLKMAVDTEEENVETVKSFTKDPLAEENTGEDAGEDIREDAGEHPRGDANTGESAGANPEANPLVPSGEKLQISEQAEKLKPENLIPNHLKTALSKVFSNAPVGWNPNLMGQTFLAQVENILIYQHDPKQHCDVQKFNKEGWKIFECSPDDLKFPRRLERGIRQVRRVKRLLKTSRNGNVR